MQRSRLLTSIYSSPSIMSSPAVQSRVGFPNELSILSGNTSVVLDKPSDLVPVTMSSMVSLLGPQYQSTLEAVLNCPATGSVSKATLSISADDIKVIAAEVLRISNAQPLSGEQEEQYPTFPSLQLSSSSITKTLAPSSNVRLNKFVRRLHDMLVTEKDSGIIEWRRGLLVLHSTDTFAKKLLPQYFNTRNFKTFRRQLNYYGFVHVRSFSSTGSATTALWVNRDLARIGSDDVSSVLLLKRVEPCEGFKTAEGRRVRKEQAIHTVEEDIGVNTKSLQMEQIRSMAVRGVIEDDQRSRSESIPSEISVSSASTCAGTSFTAQHCAEDENTSAANLLLLFSKSTCSI